MQQACLGALPCFRAATQRKLRYTARKSEGGVGILEASVGRGRRR